MAESVRFELTVGRPITSFQEVYQRIPYQLSSEQFVLKNSRKSLFYKAFRDCLEPI